MIVILIFALLALICLLLMISTLWVHYTHVHLGKPSANKLTVVQITDLHGRTRFMNGSLSQLVNKVKPGYVMVTGDLASRLPSFHNVLAEVRRITCPHRYFVPGNHERQELVSRQRRRYSQDEYAQILRMVEAANLKVLSNQGTSIQISDKRILIYGFDNSINKEEQLTLTAEDIQQYDYVIMLAHSPSIIHTALSGKVPWDLLLVGHTHGGQIRLLDRTIGAYKHCHVGLKALDSRKMFYINRGLGTARIPIRWACPPEIAVFHIYL
ncbi:metallophosphoesterase [Paenibacillus roseipurpureus]|uniref:Metallophosphoesterase n=1 Tax=Paenibacillus roseopurpureus TaxID=2918901 RepID=A0AA96RIG4_9BACL|nr:metallophosphoesterase [Paenibacillus sp. MBLB1832]WNR42081.1 metallophosphoesterase [Paenibacillus sp. MBLB1832]